MKKLLSALAVVAMIVGGVLMTSPVFASEKCSTSILPESLCGESETGQGIADMLSMTVDIMTVGVGILGVIGITIVGIQYLTASGSEEKTRKAKRRLFEIVIGIAAFVLLGALAKFLIPNIDVK